MPMSSVQPPTSNVQVHTHTHTHTSPKHSHSYGSIQLQLELQRRSNRDSWHALTQPRPCSLAALIHDMLRPLAGELKPNTDTIIIQTLHTTLAALLAVSSITGSCRLIITILRFVVSFLVTRDDCLNIFDQSPLVALGTSLIARTHTLLGC